MQRLVTVLFAKIEIIKAFSRQLKIRTSASIHSIWQKLVVTYAVIERFINVLANALFDHARMVVSKLRLIISGVRRAVAFFVDTPYSLSNELRKDERVWRKSNETLLSHSFNKSERLILHLNEHPIRYTISMSVGMLALFTFALESQLDMAFGFWFDWRAEETLAYFSTVWAIQATLVALVYPIAISFIAIYLQRKPKAEALLHLYILHSSALFAGLASLALVVIMAVQYMIIPFVGIEVLKPWAVIDTAWLSFNSLFTAYFLVQTVLFLRDHTQNRVIKGYVAVAALPRLIRNLYGYQKLHQEQQRYWPSNDKEHAISDDEPSVSFLRFSLSDYEEQGAITFKRPARVVNIRFWFLRFAVSSWLTSAKMMMSTGETKARPPHLIVPIMPGQIYSGDAYFSRVARGPALTWLQENALKLAYVFRKQKVEQSWIDLSEIQREFELDARDAAERSDNSRFEQAYSNLVDFHKFLLNSCVDKNQDGTVGSWSILPNSNSFFGQALHVEWADAYRSVFVAAIQSMERDVRPFRRCCHLTQHLVSENLLQAPVEIREHLLQLPPLLMYFLSKWWMDKVEQQGTVCHNHSQAVMLQPPLSRLYEDATGAFIGGWENARGSIAFIPDKGFNWASQQNFTNTIQAHLNATARMLLEAISRGDRTAAEWLADSLNKWFDDFRHDYHHYALYRKSDFISVDSNTLDWPSAAGQLGFSDIGSATPEQLQSIQHSVFVCGVKNLWTDIRLVVIYVLISWMDDEREKTSQGSFALEFVAGLLNGKQWRQGGSRVNSFRDWSGDELLVALVRQFHADGNTIGRYSATLSQLVERVKDSRRTEMISSRTYSSYGANDLDSLQSSALVLFRAITERDVVLPESLRQQVLVWLDSRHECINSLINRAKNWLEQIADGAKHESMCIDSLTLLVRPSNDVSTSKDRVARCMRSFIELLEGLKAQAIIDSPVDEKRLEKIAEFASQSGFSLQNGRFPLHLFRNRTETGEELDNFTLTINQYRKGELTENRLEQRAANDGESFSEMMAEQVAAVVMFDTIKMCRVREVSAPDPRTYWEVVKFEAGRWQNEGEEVLLLLDNATLPDWVWDWQHVGYHAKHERPRDLQVQRRANQGHGYVCHFNETAVFVAPIPAGQSILILRSAFQQISFTRYQNNHFVDVSFSPLAESSSIGDLKLRFSRSVTALTDTDCVRIYYSSNEGG